MSTSSTPSGSLGSVNNLPTARNPDQKRGSKDVRHFDLPVLGSWANMAKTA